MATKSSGSAGRKGGGKPPRANRTAAQGRKPRRGDQAPASVRRAAAKLQRETGASF